MNIRVALRVAERLKTQENQEISRKPLKSLHLMASLQRVSQMPNSDSFAKKLEKSAIKHSRETPISPSFWTSLQYFVHNCMSFNDIILLTLYKWGWFTHLHIHWLCWFWMYACMEQEIWSWTCVIQKIIPTSLTKYSKIFFSKVTGLNKSLKYLTCTSY